MTLELDQRTATDDELELIILETLMDHNRPMLESELLHVVTHRLANLGLKMA